MKMKNTLTALMVLASLSLSTFASAEDVVLPVIAKPSVLQEGTQRNLSAEQIAELLPWAKNSKVFLNDLLNTVQGLSSNDKLDRMEDGIKSIVGESSPKHSELLMRYVLNRGLAVNDLLKAEMNADEVGSIDTKLRVLTLSIKMAITYYDTDMNTLSKKTNAPFIQFGIEYFNFLTELNKSIFDASASYNIQRTALEWLQWDLYRDLNNQQMAVQIVKINNSLKIYPAKQMKDSQYISYIRQMKLMTQQLDLRVSSSRRTQYENSNDNYSSNNGGKTSSGEQYIAVCSTSFSDNSYKSACMKTAKELNLDPEMINVCGTSLGSDSKRFECLNSIAGKKATRYNVAAYTACGNNFSDNSYRNACMKVLVSASPKVIDINACGSSLGTDSKRYECLNKITSGKATSNENLAEIVETCSSIMSDNSYRIACLNYPIDYGTKIEDIKACGSNLGTDSSRLKCLEYVGDKKLMNSSRIIEACGSIMSDNSYRTACVSTGMMGDLSPNGIRACGSMGSDSSRYTCVQAL